MLLVEGHWEVTPDGPEHINRVHRGTPASVHRPTELFRSCNVQSDQGALNDIKLWSNGTIKMPFMNIPVLDIRKCLPDMWKAVACSLQIKPCHKSRGSVICKYGSFCL